MFLSIRDLKFRYQKKSDYVINGLTLNLQKNSFSALMGPSGCGKSTLLRLIVGLYSPFSGEIFLDDKILNGRNPVQTENRNIGMVFQDNILFPHMTVAQNIVFGMLNKHFSRTQRLLRLDTILELIEMKEFINFYPHMLSGGQQKRVALGRSLAPSPKLLLLDEPFSNLDNTLREKIRWEVKILQKKLEITTLFVTHDLSDLNIADSVLYLNNGEISLESST